MGKSLEEKQAKWKELPVEKLQKKLEKLQWKADDVGKDETVKIEALKAVIAEKGG
eukprot:CAMPEP_0197847494 /NCGR_PEP_ID=MMETSP1438-20131217/6347_1 /TAXON_ID=1461541 /ORGANISM="Pterosperma sp., Strain CCMP1384" /LENGTH=54 /DNA_ID=CAMNT_0043459435 /DNA_START=187 /DNA_END=351 /DNA_ORIENTATION=-